MPAPGTATRSNNKAPANERYGARWYILARLFFLSEKTKIHDFEEPVDHEKKPVPAVGFVNRTPKPGISC